MHSAEEYSAKDIKVIVFRLLDEHFGVDVSQVKSIERIDTITKVPRTPGFVKGVIHLRGAVIPIIDLKERLGMEPTSMTDQSRVILVTMDGHEVGIIVDSANDVMDISVSSIEPPPRMVSRIDMKYLQGIAKLPDQLLVLLNLDKVLDMEEIELIFQGEEQTS